MPPIPAIGSRMHAATQEPRMVVSTTSASLLILCSPWITWIVLDWRALWSSNADMPQPAYFKAPKTASIFLRSSGTDTGFFR